MIRLASSSATDGREAEEKGRPSRESAKSPPLAPARPVSSPVTVSTLHVAPQESSTAEQSPGHSQSPSAVAGHDSHSANEARSQKRAGPAERARRWGGSREREMAPLIQGVGLHARDPRDRLTAVGYRENAVPAGGGPGLWPASDTRPQRCPLTRSGYDREGPRAAGRCGAPR